jgi:hypothetical protein
MREMIHNTKGYRCCTKLLKVKRMEKGEVKRGKQLSDVHIIHRTEQDMIHLNNSHC